MSAGNMNLSIPTTWRFCHFGDVVDYGKTEKAEPHEIADDAWILELEDIEKDTSRVLSRVTFAERKSKSSKNQFDDGDVLYGKLRPYLNKVVIADEPGYCTTEIIPLRLTSHLDNRYLFYWLKHPSFLDYVADVSHGLNMPRLGTAAGKKAPSFSPPSPSKSGSRTSWMRCWGAWTPAGPASTASPPSSNASANPSSPPPPPES